MRHEVNDKKTDEEVDVRRQHGEFEVEAVGWVPRLRSEWHTDSG